MKTITLIALMMLLCAAHAAVAADSVMNIDEQYAVGPLGDGTVTISMNLSAAQYMQWQQRYGLNPSLLKRDMGKLVSQYDVTDFQVSQKNMDRQVTVTMKLRGVMRYKGDGQYEMDLPANWQGGTRHDNVYEFHYAESQGPGQIMQHNVRLELPRQASDFSEQLGDEGSKVITYHMPVSSGRSALPLVGGIVLLILGGAAVAAGFVLPKSS